MSAAMRSITSKMSDGVIQIGETSVAVMDANGNFRDLIDILGDVETATDGMGTAEKAAALSMTFTDDALKGVNLVLNEGIDKIRGYKAELENCDGAAQQMAKTMSDNLNGAISGASSAAQGLGEAVYDYFSGPLTDAFNNLTDVINAVTDEIQREDSELQTYIDHVGTINDNIKDKLESVQNSMMTNYSQSQSIVTYIQTLDELRKKQSLNSYETYQLNRAVSELSGNFPQLSQYVDSTGDLMNMTAEDFRKLRSELLSSWGDINTAADVAERNQYLQIKADADDAVVQAQAAVDELNQQISKKEKEMPSYNFDSDRMREEAIKLKELKDQRKEANKELANANQYQTEANERLEDYDNKLQSFLDRGEIYIDETGQMVLKTEEIADATATAGDSFSDMGDAAEDSADDVEDAMTDAVDAYKQALQEFQNQSPADAMRSQMAAAVEQIIQFKETIQNSFSNFSLFGDTTDLMDIYTSSSKTEMQKNMEQNLNLMGKYADELKNLKDRGMSDDFLSYLTSQGTQGIEYIHNLATWTNDEELKAFQAQFDQYASYSAGTNERVKSIMESYAETVMNGVEGGYGAWYQYGIQTTQGLLDAIAEVQAQMDNGLLTGSITESMRTYLQATQDNTAAYNSRTGTVGESVNTARVNESTRTIVPNVFVDVTMDGDQFVSKVNTRIQDDLRISGGHGRRF